MTDLTMEFVTDLPPSHGFTGLVYESMLLIVDQLTKMARYIPTCKTMPGPKLAGLVYQEIISKFGIPDSFAMDRGSLFPSHFWSSIYYT